jgi:hypothetical protein
MYQQHLFPARLLLKEDVWSIRLEGARLLEQIHQQEVATRAQRMLWTKIVLVKLWVVDEQNPGFR